MTVWQPHRALAPGLFCATFSTAEGFEDRDDAQLVQAIASRIEGTAGDPAAQTPSMPRAVRWLSQVHGVRVLHAQASAPSPPVPPEADAAWTADPGLALTILSADCLPWVIADRSGSCVAVAHAGWRGLFAGVLARTVASMPVAAGHLRAWCGPGISGASYEVGAELLAALRALDLPPAVLDAVCVYSAADRARVDLRAIARWQLQQLGVGSIESSGVCTLLDTRCHSFRRDATRSRMVTVACLLNRAG